MNINPGKYGKPMVRHNFKHQILGPLHMSELNIRKIPYKHGTLSNTPDDAREAISEQLKDWMHPLDTRRVDDNRRSAQKWLHWARWVRSWGHFRSAYSGRF